MKKVFTKVYIDIIRTKKTDVIATSGTDASFTTDGSGTIIQAVLGGKGEGTDVVY